MARISIAILLLFHGAIHLFGFVKELNLAPVPQLSGKTLVPIRGVSKQIAGVLWLLIFLGCATAGVGLLLDKPWWWPVATAAIAASQLLIVLYWKDAWAGTIPNILIGIAVFISAAATNLNRMIDTDITTLFASTTGIRTELFTAERIQHLPPCVQTFIRQSNVIGKEIIYSARLKQKGEMRTKPDASWMPMEAQHYCTYSTPGFVWKGKVAVAPFISLVARDKYLGGNGNMLIKALSAVTIADSRGSEIDQGTLIRFLAEMIWAPSSLTSEYIQWEPVDSLSARATMTYGGVSGSGVFRFSANGEMVGFEAKRYREVDGAFSLDTWSITTRDPREFQGIRIPAVNEVTWTLPSGDFTWLKLELTNVEYNVKSTF